MISLIYARRTLGWFKNVLLFQNHDGTPKYAQIHEKTPHKRFQLDRLRVGRVNLLLSFSGGLTSFWGKQNNISNVNF